MGKNFPKTHASTHALGGIDPVEGAGPVPGPNNSRYVLSLADLPAPEGTTITLEPGQDYQVIGPVDMGVYTLRVAGASIRGYAPQTGALFWTAAPTLGVCVLLGDEGWIENLTLTSAAAAIVSVEGTRKKRVQLCDMVGPLSGPYPAIFVGNGLDGLQCFDCFVHAGACVLLLGGAQIVNPSFELSGAGASARAVSIGGVAISAAILVESAQVRGSNASQAAFEFATGASFTTGFAGLISGLQSDVPALSGDLPAQWKLSGSYRVFEGTAVVRRVVGPATVTLAPWDEVVECDPTAGLITVNIPQTFTGHDLSVRDVAGAASVNAIVCAGAGGADVDGAASVSITSDYGYLELFAAVAFPGAIDWWVSSGG